MTLAQLQQEEAELKAKLHENQTKLRELALAIHSKKYNFTVGDTIEVAYAKYREKLLVVRIGDMLEGGKGIMRFECKIYNNNGKVGGRTKYFWHNFFDKAVKVVP